MEEKKGASGEATSTHAPSAATLLEVASALTALHGIQPPAPTVNEVVDEEAPCRQQDERQQSQCRDAASVACDRSASFPERLMAVLSDPDASACISWLPDGQSFVVTSPQKLTLEVLPKYFGQTEFASFTRKLYWWGFKKSSRSKSAAALSGGEADSYRHELFQRDRPEFASKMRGAPVKRKRKATGVKTSAAASKFEPPQAPYISAAKAALTASPRMAPPLALGSRILPPLLSPTVAKNATAENLTLAERALRTKSNAIAASSLAAASFLHRQKLDLEVAAVAAFRASTLLPPVTNSLSGAGLPPVAELPVHYVQLLAGSREFRSGNSGGLTSHGASVTAHAFYVNAIHEVRRQQQQAAQMRALAVQTFQQRSAAPTSTATEAASELQQVVSSNLMSPVAVQVHHHRLGGKTYNTASRNSAA